MAAVAAADGLIWSALDASGATVGWLWVQTAAPDLPPDAAYLSQILVKPEARPAGSWPRDAGRAGRGPVQPGISEIHLHTNNTNLPGQQLYAAATSLSSSCRRGDTSVSGCTQRGSRPPEPERRGAVCQTRFGVPYCAPDGAAPSALLATWRYCS